MAAPAVQANVALLREPRRRCAYPAVGRLTGADSGAGRLPDPPEIFAAAVRLLAGPMLAPGRARDLAGRRVAVSAGGTRQEIDPVRFIGNWSTGTQGYALARSAVARGAEVTVVAANVALPYPAGVAVIWVVSAREMQSAVTAAAADADVVVMAAAVADYRPEVRSEGKIKKDGSSPNRCAWSRTRTSWPGWPRSATGPAAAGTRSWSGSPLKPIPPSRRPGPSWPAKGVTCWWSTRSGTG